MGTVAVTNKVDGVLGSERYVEATVTGSASYATGGDALPSLGLREVRRITVLTDNRGAASPKDSRGVAYPAHVTKTVVLGGTVVAPTLQYFTGTTQEANASSQAAVSHRVRFFGV